MEKTRPDEDISPITSKEKSKKSKQFISYLSKIFNKEKVNEPKTEDNIEPKKDFLQVVIDYLDETSNEKHSDLNNIDQNEEVEIHFKDELEDAKQYVDETLRLNLESISNKGLDLNNFEEKKLNILVLSKVKDCLDNDKDIDIEEIIFESSNNIENVTESEVNDESLQNPNLIQLQQIRDQIVKNKSKANINKDSSPNKGTLENTVNEDKNIEMNNSSVFIDSSYSKTDKPNINIKKPDILSKENILKPIGLSEQKEIHKNIQNNNLIKDLLNENNSRHIEKSKIQKQNEKIKKQAINKSEQEVSAKYFIDESKYTPSDIEILRKAEKTYVDKVSLRKFYENSDLSIGDLRKIMASKNNKYRGPLKRALERRHNNYSDILSSIKHRTSTNSSTSPTPQNKNPNPPKLKNSKLYQKYSSSNTSKNKTENKQTMPILTILVLIVIFILFLFILFLWQHK